MNITTVSVRSIVISAAVAAAVGISYVVGAGNPDGVRATAAEEAEATGMPGIVMTGVGEVIGVPDQLSFDVSVKARAADVSAAMASANRKTRRVLRALRDGGIPRADVQTTGLSIHPDYDYSGEGAPVLVGYSVSQSLDVLAKELDGAGEAMTAVVEAGGNSVRINDVRLRIGDLEALRARARDAAMEQAMAKAEQYALAAGLELGGVQSIREVDTSLASGFHQQATWGVAELRDLAAADRAVPVRAGTENIGVNVSVVWSFA